MNNLSAPLISYLLVNSSNNWPIHLIISSQSDGEVDVCEVFQLVVLYQSRSHVLYQNLLDIQLVCHFVILAE